MKPVALTIAGSDPSGGAGIQADLKTFQQFGVYGEAAISLITVQNTVSVSRVFLLEPALVAEQIRAVREDIPPDYAKTGALGNAAIVEAVADQVKGIPLVVDPVLISKHGTHLAEQEAVEAIRRHLIPNAALITPNLSEAAALAGCVVETPEQMVEAGRCLLDMGAAAVLVKGGHLEGHARDVLVTPLGVDWHSAERIDTPHTHGTGCTYSAAITALLARNVPLVAAIARAKTFVTEAIRSAPGLGAGMGPVNHQVEAS
jgi:hydroxymethylpyrimidine/phosphomethylpyrimidine kinase